MKEERTLTLSAEIYVYGGEEETDCSLCGEPYMRHHANVMLVFWGEGGSAICPQCFMAGPSGAAARARKYAQELKRDSSRLQAKAEQATEIAYEVEQITEWPSLEALLKAQRSEPTFPPDLDPPPVGAMRNRPF